MSKTKQFCFTSSKTVTSWSNYIVVFFFGTPVFVVISTKLAISQLQFPWWNHNVPIVFPWFSYVGGAGPMFSYVFDGFLWWNLFFYGFSMVFLWFPMVFLWFFLCFGGPTLHFFTNKTGPMGWSFSSRSEDMKLAFTFWQERLVVTGMEWGTWSIFILPIMLC